MAADIAESSRTEHCITNGVQHDVGVGMAEQPGFMWNADTTEDELSTGHEWMDIISNTRPRSC